MKSKIYIIFAMLIFGSIGLFVKEIDLSSSQIALARGIIGSGFLWISSLFLKEKISWKAMKGNVLLLLISGTAIGFNWILLFESYKYTTIANATLSYYFAPVFVLLLSPFILKEKLTGKKAASILLAMAGMFLIVGVGSSESENANHLLGIGYGLAAAALYASVILINKFLKGLSGLETTFVQLTLASFVLLPYVLFTENIEILGISRHSILMLVIVGVIHTGFAYLLYFSSMQKLKGQTIAVLSYIDPISAIVMSGIFLGEKMNTMQILGGVLILGATALGGQDN